jgi:hypothetical protein
MSAKAPDQVKTAAQTLLGSLPRLMASRLSRLPMPVVRDTAKESRVYELLSAWLERSDIHVHPYARQDCASFVVCLWNATGHTPPERLTRLAVLVLGWFMADAACGKDDRFAAELAEDYWHCGKDSPDATQHTIYLCNSFYAADTNPQTLDLVAHYMREWGYGSLFENSWRRASPPPTPHDILVRSRDMMVGFLPALAADLTPTEIQAWERYAHTELSLDIYLSLCRKHVTFVNDITGLQQFHPAEPNAAASYANTPHGTEELLRYANAIADELELRYRALTQLGDNDLTSLCDKAMRFCSGGVIWHQTCHRYNELIKDHDPMFVCGPSQQ